MSRFLCCCCCCSPSENSDSERQPLLPPGPSDQNGVGSARNSRPAHSAQNQTGRLVMKRVCVPELDQRFSEIAETFNEQQERYEAMVRHIRNLQADVCNRNDTLTLAECARQIREKHEAKYKVSIKMKGYDFSLDVVPVGPESEEEALPPHLRIAQGELKGISESAKATTSKGTTLQELTGWLLRSKDQMAEQVMEAAATHQEKGRLNKNLEVNMKEVKRARELSQGYREQARKVFTEAAQIAGVHQ